jgi:hypothetical protein
MFDVWSALREDGIEVPYDHFRVYVSRIRRRMARSSTPPPAQASTDPGQAADPKTESTVAAVPPSAPPDPYSAVRAQRRLKQQSGFEYDPFSSDKDLLE